MQRIGNLLCLGRMHCKFSWFAAGGKAVYSQLPSLCCAGCAHMRVQGRMTLLLGPPSSGKSTFMRLLAGRLASGYSHLQV
jgi:ABC-type sulfate/molybdate transport systems ATPase subunit